MYPIFVKNGLIYVLATQLFHGWAIHIDNTLPSGEWWIALLGCVVQCRRQCSLGTLNQCCSKKMIMIKKMLNRPKIVNAIGTKVLLWFFPPACLVPHSYFLKTSGWYLGTFYTHNLPHYECFKGHITCQVTCYVPLIPITCSKHA